MEFRCTPLYVIVYLRYVVDPPAWLSTFLLFVPYRQIKTYTPSTPSPEVIERLDKPDKSEPRVDFHM